MKHSTHGGVRRAKVGHKKVGSKAAGGYPKGGRMGSSLEMHAAESAHRDHNTNEARHEGTAPHRSVGAYHPEG